MRFVLSLFIFFFLITDVLNVGVTAYNGMQWNKDAQLQLSRWINGQRSEFNRLIIDKDGCTNRLIHEDKKTLCVPGGRTTLVGFWVNKEILVTSVDAAKKDDMIVTMKQLSLPLLKETEGIKIYKKD